ncbi:ATP-binding protein [Streptomyces sp. P9(2023)]|uniref:ATP-binding protein n=1 Tax=Streptomyces sp. P9(2023) TaxID=3064394 RepID=UPI0028F3FCBF|nr:ATP-binding protein [Streptomyces sp. P9(2023)]MDT9689246.1 ATP-binding protein [Streptomyces sp. P9(2023)]
MGHEACMARPPWELPFLAEPGEVAALRRIVRTHLRAWGLPDQTEVVQACVTELVANVINHVGIGTPTTLALSMRDTYLRIEVSDPDTRALPTLLQATTNSESGRGMLMVDVLSDRWGVQLREDRKVTWCEIATDLSAPNGHSGGARVTRAEAMISLYGAAKLPRRGTSATSASQPWRNPQSMSSPTSSIGSAPMAVTRRQPSIALRLILRRMRREVD